MDNPCADSYQSDSEHFESDYKKKIMIPEKYAQICYACGKPLEKGETNFTADFDSAIVLVHNVPAAVYAQWNELMTI